MEIDENGVLNVVENADLKDGTINLPPEVKYIGKFAFLGCSELTHLKIPEGVVGIGEYAFRSCFRLSKVEIPSSVKFIRGNSFAIPDFFELENPLKTVIVTPDRKIDDRFKSYFPPKVNICIEKERNL